MIFNTGTHNTKGEHFVAICVVDSILWYYDSFGEPPKNSYILDFIKKCKPNKTYFNNIQHQDNDSIFCGYFALSYLCMKYYSIADEVYFSLLSKVNLKENNNIVISFISSAIKV